MSTHTALPAEGAVEQTAPERPAAGRWHRDPSTGRWLVKVRASVHRPGRAAKVRGRDRIVTPVVLGEVVGEHAAGFVLSEFTDPAPKPPRGGAGRAATERQRERLAELWSAASAGGSYVSTRAHILSEPDWENLSFADASWYLDVLKAEVSQ